MSCPVASPRPPASPLNVFQYLARQWDRVHPYNAAQALEITGVADVERINDAWLDVLRTLGVGRVRVAAALGKFGFEAPAGDDPELAVRTVPPTVDLYDYLSAELNRPFDESKPDAPFRAFVRQGIGSYHLGVVYQHWTADSVSVQMLLRELFYRLYDPARARRCPVRVQRTGYWGLYGPSHGRWRLDESLFALARRYFRYRRVRKVASIGLDDPSVRVRRWHAEPGLIDRLCVSAHAAGVKVHDVLVATMAEACAEHVPTQFRRRRRDLAVGAIIDLRPLSRQEIADDFGVYLGFTGTIVHECDLRHWPRLLKSVAGQNRHAKAQGIPQSSLAWMLAARLISRYVPKEKLWGFYRKEMPLLGGLSNLNLTNGWAADYAPRLVRDYIRCSPTGPIAPLAIATTTFGDQFSIAVTYRASLVDDAMAERFVETFLARLYHFAAGAIAGSQMAGVENSSPVVRAL
jgi:hypothetical protein